MYKMPPGLSAATPVDEFETDKESD
jgi:hypothetical protein